jgi:DNA-binding beta-propeller fold protein YncE
MLMVLSVGLSLYFGLRPSVGARSSPTTTRLTAEAVGLQAPAIALADAGGSLWAVVEESRGKELRALLWRLDPRSGKRLGSFVIGRAGPDFGALTSSRFMIWAAAGNHLLRVDLAHRGQVGRTGLPGYAASVAVAFGSVWVTTVGGNGDSLVRLNADTLAPEARIRLDTQPMAMASGLGSLWLALGSSLQRIDPRVNRLIATRAQPTSPIALTVSGDRLWVLQGTDAVTVLDRHGREREHLRLPFSPGNFSVASRRLWVTDNRGCRRGTLAVIDPARSEARTIAIGGTPNTLTTAGTRAWVATFGDAKLWRVSTGR